MSSEAPEWMAPTAVESGPVTVVREIELRESGAVATFTATSDHDEPLLVEATHELPAAIPDEMLGFRPGAEPRDWSVEDGTVRVRVVVPPDGELFLAFGLTVEGETELPEELPPPTIERISVFDPPVDEGQDAAEP